MVDELTISVILSKKTPNNSIFSKNFPKRPIFDKKARKEVP